MPKGALHIHSTHSDGELTLAEVRTVYLAAGCRFACVTDHADWFDDRGLDEYVTECAALSDDQFTFIAGLEFPCLDRMHIVGYGATALTGTVEPAGVIRHIAASGGVSVIAHPKDAHFSWIDRFDTLPDGLEVWNTKYDGQYAPRRATFELLDRMRVRRADVRAFYGQDLHWRTQYRGLFVHVDAGTIGRESVLGALRAGAYWGDKDGVRLPSDGRLSGALLGAMERVHRRSVRMRGVMQRVKRVADRLGMPVPRRLKAQVRRVI